MNASQPNDICHADSPKRMSRQKEEKLVWFYLILTFFLWGSLYVVSKYVLDKVPPFTVSALRQGIAVIVLFALARRQHCPPPNRTAAIPIILIGIFGYFIAQVLQFMGTKFSNASFAALINSLNPVVIMLMAALFLHEKITLPRAAGLALSLCGVYVILGGGIGGDMTLGVILSLISVFIWSLVSICLRKLSTQCPPLVIVTWGTLVAVLCGIPCSLIELYHTPAQWDWSILPAMIYMGILCTGAAHLLWNKSLALAEAGTCAAFYPIQPLTASALGILFLNESVTLSFCTGSALIIAGVLLCLKKTQQTE